MKQLLNLLFPKHCVVCKKEGSFLCDDCLSLIEINPFRYCLCEKLKKEDKCNNCKNRYLDKIFSASDYNNKIVKTAIHKFKYSYIKELSLPFSFLILKHLENVNCSIDNSFVLVPVPLSQKKIRKRGFNQSEEIAKNISKVTGLLLDSNCLIKIKENKSQAELNKTERINNIKNVFKVTKELKNKNILLIDDVYTTGSTMEECSKELKKAGANKVWGITIAREMVDL